jgi:hypothetical protein
MKNHKVFVVMLIALMGLGLVLIPKAFSQVNPNVKVLSYSYYVNTKGDFIVVGEVQNDGNSILESVTVNATAYDSSGDGIAGSNAPAYVSDFLPQQKAPFYIDLGQSSVAGDDWGSTVTSVDFTVYNTISTKDVQYGVAYNGNNETLIPTVNFNGTVDGPYDVIGFVSNIGNQTADAITVVGTYYNSAGTVVAVGYVPLTGSLPPYNATTFTLSEFDASASLVAQIANYSLLVQTSTLQSSNSNLPTSGSSNTLPSTDYYAIVALAVVAIILIVVVLLVLRKRQAASASPLPPPASPESSPPPPPPPQE